MDAGADDILEKPFRIQRLREMVDEQLQKVHH
jgi:DNA-binding response OmpR family regulator